MGLDMYLYAERYVFNDAVFNADDPAIYKFIAKTIESDTLPEPKFGGMSVRQCVGYWRKANAIHGWFVRELADGVDNCRDIYVPKEALIKLRDNCVDELANRAKAKPNESKHVIKVEEGDTDVFNKIIADIKQEHENTKTKVITNDPLAPTAGFFFGSNEKDEWYYNDLEYTVELINSLLANKNTYDYYYRASW